MNEKFFEFFKITTKTANRIFNVGCSVTVKAAQVGYDVFLNVIQVGQKCQ